MSQEMQVAEMPPGCIRQDHALDGLPESARGAAVVTLLLHELFVYIIQAFLQVLLESLERT